MKTTFLDTDKYQQARLLETLVKLGLISNEAANKAMNNMGPIRATMEFDLSRWL